MSTPTIIEYRSSAVDMTVEKRKHGLPALRGYAIRWNSLSEPMFGFRERVRKGATAESIRTGDPRCCWNHLSDKILGRKSAGTLKLWEDSVGLYFEAVPPSTTWASDLIESIKRRDVKECSFAFVIQPNGDTWSRKDGEMIRELVQVDLIEVSPVSWPAYSQTEVHVVEPLDPAIQRALEPYRRRLDELERLVKT